MAAKEGRIFIEISCANCGAVVKNGWSYHPKEDEKTVWTTSCPVCKQPAKIEFTVN